MLHRRFLAAFVLLAAPVLAAAAAARPFWSNRQLRRYWYTAPAILLAKLAWCAGAANHPWSKTDRGPR